MALLPEAPKYQGRTLNESMANQTYPQPMPRLPGGGPDSLAPLLAVTRQELRRCTEPRRRLLLTIFLAWLEGEQLARAANRVRQ
jgi:hypothetical protein